MLELPATAWLRRYRVRALGRVTQEQLDRLRAGITVEGIRYGPIEATLEREQGANLWLGFAIREGKNREVRKVLETLALKVNRLIRVAFGPFQLGELAEGAVKEIESAALRTELGEKIVAQANADFDAPLVDHDLRVRPSRHPEVRARDAREPRRMTGKGPSRASFEARQSRAPQDDGSTTKRDRGDKKLQQHAQFQEAIPEAPRPQRRPAAVEAARMIPKSGNRFSDKIMRKEKF